MQYFLLFSLLSLTVLGEHKTQNGKAGITYTDCYPLYNQQDDGFGWWRFSDYIPNLTAYDYDDVISSARVVNGMWIYYENNDYNPVCCGGVYWIHGVDLAVNLPAEYDDSISSLKYAGNHFAVNENSFTLYDGAYFTGEEFYGTGDYNSLGTMNGRASSIIVTGNLGYSFYNSGSQFVACIYADTDADTGSDGTILNFGIYGDLNVFNADNQISIVRVGCPLTEEHKAGTPRINQNGAWGSYKPKKA